MVWSARRCVQAGSDDTVATSSRALTTRLICTAAHDRPARGARATVIQPVFGRSIAHDALKDERVNSSTGVLKLDYITIVL
jgi:hypothetical protein